MIDWANPKEVSDSPFLLFRRKLFLVVHAYRAGGAVEIDSEK